MRQITLALLALTLSLLACSRNISGLQHSTDTKRTLNFGGIERNYILHIPSSYNGNPVAVVMVFHGGTGNAENAQRMTGFNTLSDEKGFAVVYPNGTGLLKEKVLTWNGGTCCGYAQQANIDDVGFVHAMIADLETVVAIDPKRIYATGISNGAIMSYRLACEAGDLIAAIGPVSGTQNIVPCEPKSLVSVIDFHGTADEHIPYNGGFGNKSLVDVNFASVKDSAQFWVNQNQCPPTPQTQTFADIQHETYANCANGTAVELYTIIGGKHAWPGSDGPAWPGGDQPTQSISATKLIWDFFAAHPKP